MTLGLLRAMTNRKEVNAGCLERALWCGTVPTQDDYRRRGERVGAPHGRVRREKVRESWCRSAVVTRACRERAAIAE